MHIFLRRDLFFQSWQIHRAGRAKDMRKFIGEVEETRKQREDGVKLEYRDEWGRECTRKEAWRNLCYQVTHGWRALVVVSFLGP